MKCPKCEGRMAEGFVPDYSHGAVLQGRWVQGAPKKNFWTGIKIEDPIYVAKTYRCETCGFLESYATERITRGFFTP